MTQPRYKIGDTVYIEGQNFLIEITGMILSSDGGVLYTQEVLSNSPWAEIGRQYFIEEEKLLPYDTRRIQQTT